MSVRMPVFRSVGAALPACVAVGVLTIAVSRVDLAGQGRGQGRGGGPPQTARQAAPVDLTGTWVSIVSEDWRWRMVTPPKGDVSSIPVNGEARKVAASWNLDGDNSSGNQCKAFGIGGIIRQPGRVRISWQDDQTLKLEFDAGTQTRIVNFDRTKTASSEKTWQGFSLGQWEGPGVGRGGGLADGRPDVRVTGGGLLDRGVPGGGGGGLRGGPPPRQQAQIERGGDLKIVTTNFREGYLRKNGVPYSDQASITEYFHRLPTHPNGDSWLHVITIIEDPKYLTQPFYTSTSFRLEPNDTKFKPTPCETAAPLPVKATTK